jgi:hypothetical protein
MPGFGSGLAHALTQGYVGAQEGADENRKQLIILAAQRRQEERQKQQDELARIGALTNAAQAGLDIGGDQAPPSAPPVPMQAGAPAPLRDDVSGDGAPTVAVKDTASIRAMKNQNPVSPEAGAANQQPAEPSQDGTVVGQVGKYTLRIPPAGLQGKAARDQAQKDAQRTQERYSELSAAQEGITDPKLRRTPSQLRAIASSDVLYNKYVADASGLNPDRNPVVGSPEWRQAKIEEARIGAQYGYHPPPQPASAVLTTDKNGNTYAFDPKTRTMQKVMTPDGDTFTAQPKATSRGADGPLNQDETYAAQHLPIVARSIGVIEKSLAPGIWQTLAHRNLIGNYTLTPQGQQYNAAVDRAALSLAVTLEGPRGATPQRVAIVKQTYFPQPGDDESTKTDKVARLKDAVRNGKVKAGRAFARMAPQDRDVIEQFSGVTPDAATTSTAANPFASLIPAAKTP